MSASRKIKPVAGTVFADAIGALGLGVAEVINQDGPQASDLPLDMIDVREQVRTSFDDTDDNSLKGLAESIKRQGQLQPILVRPKDGRYELIAGERRYRATKLAGKSSITAFIREIADDQVEDAQLAENIQRENLTQIEIAKKLKRDLDAVGGSLDKLAKQHSKSKPWLSKMLGLLDLPEQARRVVKENISADLEVINTVKQVEKLDKQAAIALVDNLKATRGKQDARATARSVRDVVKPSKSPTLLESKVTTVATAGNRRSERPIGGKVTRASTVVLDKVLALIESRKRPESILSQLEDNETEALTVALRSAFDEGRKATNTARIVLEGLRSGRFSPDGHGALILAAYLLGSDATTGNDFRLDAILAAMR